MINGLSFTTQNNANKTQKVGFQAKFRLISRLFDPTDRAPNALSKKSGIITPKQTGTRLDIKDDDRIAEEARNTARNGVIPKHLLADFA